MQRVLSFCLVVTALAYTGIGQSTPQPSTLPHPPPPLTFPQIEGSSRIGARRPGESPKGIGETDRKRLAALRKPNPEDLAKYQEFLRLDDTGLVRIYPNADCEQKSVVKVDGECANFVTGASGISFRKDSEHFDLRLAGGQLIADGFFSFGILVDLADTDPGLIDISDQRLSGILEFKPATILGNAKQQRIDMMSEPNAKKNYSYRIAASADNTYGVRIVAFKPGNIEIQRFGRDRDGVKDWEAREKFNSLKYDDRSDVVAIFRIIRKDEDGSITILWRRLWRRHAPKLMFDKDEPLADIR